MAARSHQNRRRYARTEARYMVQLQPVDALGNLAGVGLTPCISHDISEGGMGVWADAPNPGWAELVVSFEHEEEGVTRIMSRTGSVVRTYPVPSEGRYLLGIRFTDGRGYDMADWVPDVGRPPASQRGLAQG